MTDIPNNILHMPEYQVLSCNATDDEMHPQVDVPDPIACEECGVQGGFVRFGKRDVPYRDLSLQHPRRVRAPRALALVSTTVTNTSHIRINDG